MPGHWIGMCAAAALILSFVMAQLDVLAVSILSAAAAIVIAAKWGIASKGRMVSWIVLVAGAVWLVAVLGLSLIHI